MKKLRIGFLLPQYSRHSKSYMPFVLQALADTGAVVDVVHPVELADLSKVRVEHDLYVLRKMSGLALSLAGALHKLGAAILNPYPVSAALRDKIITFRVLQAAGVPTPATYVASQPDRLAPLLEAGPLVIKPYQGAGGHHVHVVRTAGDLAAAPHNRREPVFAQRYHPPQGRDRKLYVIGDQVFGVKKVFPRRTEAEKQGEPFTPSPELRDIALHCGRAFRIDLYGVDIIESEGRPYVVDLTSIPGYKGVPDAPQLLARHIHAVALRVARGDRLMSSPRMNEAFLVTAFPTDAI